MRYYGFVCDIRRLEKSNPASSKGFYVDDLDSDTMEETWDHALANALLINYF